jgi:hypothetical protein
MEAHVHAHRRAAVVANQQMRWLVGGFALGFAVPFVFADLLNMQRDVYYGVYAVAAISFFVLWARATDQPLLRMLTRRWVLAITLGVLFAGVMSILVLQRDATARPDGLTLVAALLWRGVVYGAADGLLLSSFPILAVFAAFAGSPLRTSAGGRIKVGALALLASLAMTATYHAGYSDFRSGKIANPLAGDVI